MIFNRKPELFLNMPPTIHLYYQFLKKNLIICLLGGICNILYRCRMWQYIEEITYSIGILLSVCLRSHYVPSSSMWLIDSWAKKLIRIRVRFNSLGFLHRYGSWCVLLPPLFWLMILKSKSIDILYCWYCSGSFQSIGGLFLWVLRTCFLHRKCFIFR